MPKDNQIFTVQEVLADPLHPAHDEVANTILDLQEGKISMCACMGPMYGEPYCPCEMKRKNIPFSKAREEDEKRAKKEWAELIASGIFRNTSQ